MKSIKAIHFIVDRTLTDRSQANILSQASPTTRGYWNLWESLDFPGSPLEGSGALRVEGPCCIEQRTWTLILELC